MSDDQWLSAMANHIDEGPIFVGEQVVGGAEELSRDLKKLVAKNPERFSRLAGRMEATLPPTYFEAILNGLSDNGDGSVRSGTLEQVCSVLRRIKDLGIQVHGREVAWAIRALAEETLPDDIVQMLCQVALEDRDPESDSWHMGNDEESPITQAINSARGVAATALAQLLFADRSRWITLEPIDWSTGGRQSTCCPFSCGGVLAGCPGHPAQRGAHLFQETLQRCRCHSRYSLCGTVPSVRNFPRLSGSQAYPHGDAEVIGTSCSAGWHQTDYPRFALGGRSAWRRGRRA